MVTVRLPEALRKYAAGLEFVEVQAGTVDGALRAAIDMHPDLRIRLLETDGLIHHHLSLFLDGEMVARDDQVEAQVGPNGRIDVLISIAGGAEDVRMRGFRDRATVEQARCAALENVERLGSEEVGVTASAGRVLAEDVASTVDVPAFRRSTMDGYAVRAENTYGASAYSPIGLQIVGESLPGSVARLFVEHGCAVRIMTGAPIPEGADAVLRAEDATEREAILQVGAPVAEGKNVGRIGEDIDRGQVVLRSGRRLLPQDVGLLSSIGNDPVTVVRRPVVRVIVSGDELLEPGDRPHGTSIVDSNSPMLSALVDRDGGVPQVVRLRDNREAMRDALAKPGADVIVTAGAASVGTEDRVPVLVDELGEVSIHGVAMRPSSPTGVGRIGAVPVLILPGNPVSCLVAYDFFAGPVIRRMAGLPEPWPYPTKRFPLATRLVSQIGRTDYARVKVDDGRVSPLAISGASVLSSVTRASGFVVIPAGLEGYPEGADVDVHFFEPADLL